MPKWFETCPVVWEHEKIKALFEPWRVENVDDASALYFSAILPDTAPALCIASAVTTGKLGVSVGTDDWRIENNRIVKARLLHIGLTFSPAHSSTICWRADLAPDTLTPVQRAMRSRFAIAAMAKRCRDYAPAPQIMARVRPTTEENVKRRNKHAQPHKQLKQ